MYIPVIERKRAFSVSRVAEWDLSVITSEVQSLWVPQIGER